MTAESGIRYRVVLTSRECDMVLRLIATAHDTGYLSNYRDVETTKSIEESIEIATTYSIS